MRAVYNNTPWESWRKRRNIEGGSWQQNKTRLLHSLSLWAVELLVRVGDTVCDWLVYSLMWLTSPNIGGVSTGPLHSRWAAVHCQLTRPVGIATAFQRPLTVPCTVTTAYRKGCARRLWKSLTQTNHVMPHGKCLDPDTMCYHGKKWNPPIKKSTDGLFNGCNVVSRL